MWLGELITDRGIGNGMSLLIFISIAAGFPSCLWQHQGRSAAGTLFLVVIVVGLVDGRRWSSSSSRRSAASRCSTRSAWSAGGMYGGTSTYIPMKVNQAGVIPVIFASSLLYIRR